MSTGCAGVLEEPRRRQHGADEQTRTRARSGSRRARASRWSACARGRTVARRTSSGTIFDGALSTNGLTSRIRTSASHATTNTTSPTTPAPTSRSSRRRPRRPALRRRARRTPSGTLVEQRPELGLVDEELRRRPRSRGGAGGADRSAPMPTTRPGRDDRTTTRSERNTDSAIEWVTNSTAAPVCSHSRPSR